MKIFLLSSLLLLFVSAPKAQTFDTHQVSTSTGVVIPDRSVTLAARIVGRVSAVNVEEGDLVKPNDLLIDIDDAELRADLAAANARLKREELNRAHVEKLAARVRNLYDQKAASAENMDEAGFKYAVAEELVASARAAVDKARAMLAETKIRAPFGGIIVEKHVEQGDVTAPGEGLLRLEDHHGLKFRTSVKERDISRIDNGQMITITIDALDDLELEATITKIIPSGNPSTHEFVVEAELPMQDKLYPGMFGKAKFNR